MEELQDRLTFGCLESLELFLKYRETRIPIYLDKSEEAEKLLVSKLEQYEPLLDNNFWKDVNIQLYRKVARLIPEEKGSAVRACITKVWAQAQAHH